VDELDAIAIAQIGPEIERAAIFPNRTNVSFWAPTDDGVRARIFERGVGETSASGTGACGAAVAYVLDGAAAPVTVHLDGGELTVDVDADLDVRLTGWAVPVYRGQLSAELVRELETIE
jgi:diaminopimelate epimerase